ncbi:hypothetical protein E2562_008232 [Oryza meyeriana var. granulata]|uniref:Uncharacterized protein n=1 Tax=Oryza meyeriana var. granulata TaxID=110450 RepID=A0A6G1DGM9_9ORYZ|nr:hypothetical protein E2562_008232 [Oryza meyeriana var. granulata]
MALNSRQAGQEMQRYRDSLAEEDQAFRLEPANEGRRIPLGIDGALAGTVVWRDAGGFPGHEFVRYVYVRTPACGALPGPDAARCGPWPRKKTY